MDPLAEKASGWTPYRYAFNNPLLFIDPDGLFETEYKHGNESVTVNDGIEKTIEVSETDFALAKLYADLINNDESPSSKEFEEGYREFYYSVSSYDDFNLGAAYDYIYNLPNIDSENDYVKGGAPPMIGRGRAVKMIEGFSRVNKGIKISRRLVKSISNPRLKNLVQSITKGGGNTMNAVRNELATGLPTKGKFHFQKLLETRANAMKIWSNKSNLSPGDRKILKQVLIDVQKTLSGR